MKKIIALVLALVMVLSLSTVAFASEEEGSSLPSLSEVVTNSKTLLKKAVDFASNLKNAMTYIVKILPDSTLLSNIKTSVTDIYTDLYNIKAVIDGFGTISKLLKSLLAT